MFFHFVIPEWALIAIPLSVVVAVVVGVLGMRYLIRRRTD